MAGQGSATGLDVGMLEATVRAIPGVRHAAVEPEGIVRVETAPGADESQVRADVVAVLRHVFDLAPPPEADDTGDAVRPIAPRLTVIRGGLAPDEPTAVPPQGVRAMTGSSVQVPDIDVDLVDAGSSPGAAALLRSRDLAERARQRERSPYVPPMLEALRPRPVLVRLRGESVRERSRITVSLRVDGHLVEGVAESATEPEAIRRATVEATLAALRVAVPDVEFGLRAVAMVEVGIDDVAVVQVSVVSRDDDEVLTGVASVHDDSRAAICRATLDAVNRRLSLLLP